MKRFPFLWLSAVIIALDQLTKYLVRNVVEFGPSGIIRVTPSFFWLTHVQNEAAAFSFSAGKLIQKLAPALVSNTVAFDKILYIIVTIIACVLIFLFISRSTNRIEQLCLSLVLGGALGNFIDRITIGSVTDFIWWDFPDAIMDRWPVFNIADSAIVVAITIYAVWTLFFDKKQMEES